MARGPQNVQEISCASCLTFVTCLSLQAPQGIFLQQEALEMALLVPENDDLWLPKKNSAWVPALATSSQTNWPRISCTASGMGYVQIVTSYTTNQLVVIWKQQSKWKLDPSGHQSTSPPAKHENHLDILLPLSFLCCTGTFTFSTCCMTALCASTDWVAVRLRLLLLAFARISTCASTSEGSARVASHALVRSATQLCLYQSTSTTSINLHQHAKQK